MKASESSHSMAMTTGDPHSRNEEAAVPTYGPGGTDGTNREPPRPEKPTWHTPPLARELPLAVIITVWGLLSLIPLGLLALVTTHFVRGRSVELLAPLCVLVVLVTACGHIIAERIATARWRARRGWACTRCGYDLSGVPSGTCPECGADCAAEAPYLPLAARFLTPRAQVIAGLAFVLVPVAAVIWLNMTRLGRVSLPMIATSAIVLLWAVAAVVGRRGGNNLAAEPPPETESVASPPASPSESPDEVHH